MVRHGSRGPYLSMYKINQEDRETVLRIYDALGKGEGIFKHAELRAMIPYSQWLRRMSNNGWFKKISTNHVSSWKFTDRAKRLVSEYKLKEGLTTT